MRQLCSVDVLGLASCSVLWLFVWYAFFGVVVETAYFGLRYGFLECRSGLLYVPLRPLYGVAGSAITVVTRPVVGHPMLVFLLGLVVASVVEYVWSLLTEKAFKATSWDYRNHRLNLHGRVCLPYSLCWGALSLVMVVPLRQPVAELLAGLQSPGGDRALAVVVVLVALSSLLTVAALAQTRRRVRVLRSRGLGRRAWPAAPEGLVGRLAPDRVVINSFPRMSLVAELADLTGQHPTPVRFRPPAPRQPHQPHVRR